MLGRRKCLGWGILLWVAAGISTARAADYLDTLYVGENKADIRYSLTASEETDIGIVLKCTKPGGEEETLDEVSGTPPLILAGARRHEGLEPSETSHVYQLIVRSQEAPTAQQPNPPVTERVAVQILVDLGGDIAYGTPQQDDTLTGDYAPDSLMLLGLSVKNGVTLTIAAPTLLVYENCVVDGTLAFAANTDLGHPYGWFVLKTPHSLTTVTGGGFVFEPQAAGSQMSEAQGSQITVSADNFTLNGGKDCTVTIKKGTGHSLSGVKGSLTLELLEHTDAMALTVEKCEKVLSAQIMVDSGDELAFTQCALASPWNDWRHFDVSGSGKLKLEDCELENFTVVVHQTAPSQVEITNCMIKADVTAEAGGFTLEDSTLWGGVTLCNRCDAVVRNNVIRSAINFYSDQVFEGEKWSDAASPSPVIEGNTLLCETPLTYTDPVAPSSPIAIGSNYYGDANGPTVMNTFGNWDNYFLLTRGGKVDNWKIRNDQPTKIFDLAPAQKTGQSFFDPALPPGIWLAGWIMGQNTIPHSANGAGSVKYQERQTLLSLDVCTTDENVSGIEFYAVIDANQGEKIYPSSPPAAHFRDSAHYTGGGALGRRLGKSTVNFYLPPLSSPYHTLQVFMNTRGVKDASGYTANFGELKEIINTDLTLSTSWPQRKLNIAVVPVQLNVPFYTTATPNGALMADRLRADLASMLRTRSEDLHIYTSLPITYGNTLSVLSAMSTTVLTNNIATLLKLGQSFANAVGGGDQHIDYVVALMAPGTLGAGVDGASLPLRRDVIFVDAAHSSAFSHELGHACGLYLDEEQYEQFRELGLKVLAVTAFAPDPAYPMAGSKVPKRFFHFPALSSSDYEDSGYYDLMGCGENVWPIMSTLEPINSALSQLLSTAPQQASPPDNKPGPKAGLKTRGAQAPARQGLVHPAWRRVLVSCSTEPYEYEGQTLYKPISGTFEAFDASSFMQDTISCDFPDQGDPIEVFSYDNDGRWLTYHAVNIALPEMVDGQPIPTEGMWYWTYDLPIDAVKLEITRRRDDVIYLQSVPSAITNSIVSPAAGAAVGEEIELSWQATRTLPQDYQAIPNTAPLRHAVLVSTDGGTSWQPAGLPMAGTQLSIPTDGLPASSTISVRVVSSDGMASAQAQIDGLKLSNRPPRIQIVSPREGETSQPVTAWPLNAQVWDADDQAAGGAPVVGSWSSSIDGALLTGNFGQAVLSPGAHTLTFTAADSQGKSASATVNVWVGASSTIDLSLETEDLTIENQRDPLNSWTYVLNLHETNTARVRVRANGTPAQATVGLYLITPDGRQTLLTRQTLTLEAFDETALTAAFIPTVAGPCTLAAKLEGSTPADNNAANNTAQLMLYAGDPAPPFVLDLVEILLGREEGSVDLNNDGKTDIADMVTLTNRTQ